MKIRNVSQGNGWGVGSVDDYVDFPKQDETGIAVTMWNQMIPVKIHRHRFHELVLIMKGSCIHDYRGVKVALVPGDIFLIEPEEWHSYELTSNVELINCQFYTDLLSKECNETLENVKSRIRQRYRDQNLGRKQDDLIQEIQKEDQEKLEGYGQQAKLNRQGIIHLKVQERKEVEYLLQKMMEEQEHMQEGHMRVKYACLQILLISYERFQSRNMAVRESVKDFRKEAIYRTIEYMENHLDEKVDIEELAASVYWSSRHFRTVFKEVTGLTPVEYLNRVRIVKSLEYLEKNKSSIKEAAVSVGIYDTNYYTRLCKQILGYPPKYFKSI